MKRIKVKSNITKNKVPVVISNNEDNQLKALATALLGRAQVMARMGKSFGTARDIYTALGYTKTPIYADYFARYERQDIAKRVVDAPVNATWRKKPVVTEVEGDETEFEKAWNNLVKEKSIYSYFSRVDKLAGIGRYSVLLMGFDGEVNLTEPLSANGSKNLLFLQPYSEDNAQIKTWINDITDPKYGMPEMYGLQLQQEPNSAKSKMLDVHYSRVLHIAEGLLESNIYGMPKLKPVLNRLQDLELVSGGSAEMFWRGAFPGYGLVADKDATFLTDATSVSNLENEIEEYIHGLKRYMKLQGMTVEELAQQVADPSKHVEIYITLIAGATGIPKRILTGSEMGELASSQDRSNWAERIDERREDHAEPNIMRPFIDKLILAKVLPEPKEDYTIEWPDIYSPSEEDRAKVAEIRTKALAAYVNAMGADVVVPPSIFLKRFLDFTQEEIDEMEEEIEKMKAEEEKEILEHPPPPIPPQIPPLPEEGEEE